MKERPILFSAPMVRAILAGKKTQTRRLVNLDTLRVRLPRSVRGDGPWHHLEVLPGTYRAKLNPHGAVTICSAGKGFDFGVKPGEFDFVCPYADGSTHLGNYGNGRTAWTIIASGRLWVRETWAPISEHGAEHALKDARAQMPWAGIVFGADRGWSKDKPDRWRPSIHMPRWASRITVDVAGVRVERLCAITEEDARAEGVTPNGPDDGEQHRAAFCSLWHEINGAESWLANPWVWVVEFEPEVARAA